MTLLVLGLVVFLATHSVRIFADDWRTARIARMGEGAWKGLYTLVSLAGFALIVWGYGLTREQPVDVWHPPVFLRHVAALLMVLSFILLAAYKVPGNRLKTAIGHPMIVGVKVWALAHLIANGRLGDIVLFGALLVWAVLDFRAARRRDRRAGIQHPAGHARGDAITIVAGLAAYVVFAFFLHGWLIGVRPFG